MKIFITGGLGFVGRGLFDFFLKQGHSVTIVERRVAGKSPVPDGVSIIQADATRPGLWQDRMTEHDVVINLAGVSIFSRWSKKKKIAIEQSRIGITKNVADAIISKKRGKITLISASAVGYYGFHGDEKLREDDPPGSDFLAQVCVRWESEALRARESGARVIITRFGVVLGRNGGAFKTLARIFRLYLGSRLGSGNQWFSWIHQDDLISIFDFILKNSKIDGIINCTAPNPVTNRELTDSLKKSLNKFSIIPSAPGFILKILLGEFGNFLLKGQRAVPGRLADLGFAFRYPDISGALDDCTG